MSDAVKCPAHYAGDGEIECKRAVASMAAGYDKAHLPHAVSHRLQAAVEYIWRAPLKNGRQDVEKAMEDLRIALEVWDD